jgi:putative spermidine/putrescine transport system permease protein
VRNWAGPALAAPATAWLLAAFAAPLIMVILLSLQPGSDPFVRIGLVPSLEQFTAVLTDSFYMSVLLKTTLLSIGVCIAAVLLGYPFALWLISLSPKWRAVAMSVVVVPLLVNVVVRSLGIELLLAPDGLINDALALIGLPRANHMLFNYWAIGVGLLQVFLPLMILSLYDSLQAVSPRVLEASRNLGASRVTQFFTVELPMSLPGLRAGLIFVFLMASTTYVSARMLGGKQAWATGMLVWQDVLENLDAQFASALALVMTAVSLIATLLVALSIRRLTPWLSFRPARAWSIPGFLIPVLDAVVPAAARILVVLGLLLFLLPLVLVFVQSVNDVPQAAMAGFRGFTLKWYAALLQNTLYFDSLWISLELAVATSLVTVVLAALAAFALVRTRFTGMSVVETFWMFPIALPQIAIGIGMLRLLQTFTSMPAFLGLLLVHVTVTLPFCIGLLRASVQQLDITLEEAAGNLGAGLLRRVFSVILPALAPGLMAAGTVALLLSFAEVTITSFLTTARMTTLPVRIYAEATYSLEPTIFAISSLLIVMTAVCMFLLGRFIRLDRAFSR